MKHGSRQSCLNVDGKPFHDAQLMVEVCFCFGCIFLFKNSSAEGHGSDGMEDESVADAVKRSVWKMAMSLFSNFRFDADDDVVPCPIMLCSTMVSRLEFIFSSSDGSLVDVAFCVGFTGSV